MNPTASNPPNGVQVQYWLKEANREVTISVLDSAGNLIRSFTSTQDPEVAADSVKRETRRRQLQDSLRAVGVQADSVQRIARRLEQEEQEPPTPGWRPTPAPRAANRRGVNTFAWDMRYPGPSAFRGMILWAAGGTAGPMAPPGRYQVRLAVDGRTIGTESFRLLPDPRVKGVTLADYGEQFRFLRRVANRFGEANDAVKSIRFVKNEVDDRRGRLNGDLRSQFDAHATRLVGEITSVEDSIYQTRSRSGQDPLNFPIRLNNKIGALMGVAGNSAGRPTAQTYEVFSTLETQLGRELTRMRQAFTQHLTPMNATLRQAGLPEIVPRPVDVPAPVRPAVVP